MAVTQLAREAAQSGMNLRQIARISRKDGRIAAAVEFEQVELGSLFGALKGEWNALEVEYASGDKIVFRGRGAGRWPTTEVVMADIFDVMRTRAEART